MNPTDKKPRHNWRPFEESRKFIHALGLKSSTEWKDWAKSGKRPNNIPASPSGVYKNKGWKSWGDWLGTGRIAYQNMAYQPFDLARDFAHSLSIGLTQDAFERRVI